MNWQVCPLHADEEVVGARMSAEGGWAFTCPRTSGHPGSTVFRWMQAPELSLPRELSGLAEELGLATALPAALQPFNRRWVEYGVVERSYAIANPADFAVLVDRFGHTAIKAARHTASAYLARTLGDLSRQGAVVFHPGPATGRWAYNSEISWWALPPEPDWGVRTSWQDTQQDMDYVRGNTESTQLTVDLPGATL